jgi:pyridoxal phosphate enzyme (YggS family)
MPVSGMSAVAARLEAVRSRIGEAALRAGRRVSDVRLVAVTKTFPVSAALAAWEAGQRDFGENRPEEGAQKIAAFDRQLPPDVASSEQPTWHMIGHVQSRKADVVVEHFDVVHSVDRLKIARRLSRFATQLGRQIPVLLECNVSGEAAKYGYAAHNWERDTAVRTALLSEVDFVIGLPGLRVVGLMTMAPLVDDVEDVRWVFASLRSLAQALAERFPSASWHDLSMGMTDDFEVAVEEGATLVRIGRAIFGER